MARCHIDVGIQWSVPGGGSHCLGHENPVSAVVVDTGSLWRYLFSLSHKRTKETSQTTSRSHAVHELKYSANMEFVKKALKGTGRHYNVTYRKWIMDEGTWSMFVPQAEGENQREKRQAERKIIVAKYGQ